MNYSRILTSEGSKVRQDHGVECEMQITIKYRLTGEVTTVTIRFTFHVLSYVDSSNL